MTKSIPKLNLSSRIAELLLWGCFCLLGWSRILREDEHSKRYDRILIALATSGMVIGSAIGIYIVWNSRHEQWVDWLNSVLLLAGGLLINWLVLREHKVFATYSNNGGFKKFLLFLLATVNTSILILVGKMSISVALGWMIAMLGMMGFLSGVAIWMSMPFILFELGNHGLKLTLNSMVKGSGTVAIADLKHVSLLWQKELPYEVFTVEWLICAQKEASMLCSLRKMENQVIMPVDDKSPPLSL